MIKDPEKHWTQVAQHVLLGRKIVAVSYLDEKEMKSLCIYDRPIALQLDDGTIVYPMADDEGNNAGSLFTTSDKHPIIPTLR